MSVDLSPARERLMLYTLMILQFITIVDFMIIMPLSSALMKEFSIQPAEFAVLVSAYAIAASVSALLASSLADRYDRRQSLLFTFVGLLVATWGCGLAHSYEALLIARILAGFFGGVLGSVILSIVGDLFPPQKRGKAMGVIMLAFSLSAILGVPIGLMISNHFGWQMPFIVLSIAGILVLLLAYKIIPSITAHMDQPRVNFFRSYWDLLSQPNHWWAFGVASMVMMSGFLVIPFIAPTMVSNAGLTDHHLPYIYLFGGLATLVSRPIIGRYTDQYPHWKVFALITLISFIPIIVVSHTFKFHFVWHLIFSTLFFVFVSGRFIPASALITASCTPQFRGRVMAFSSAMQNLGSGIAALIAGAIMVKAPGGEILHYDWVGYLACAVGLLAVWISTRVKAVS